MARSRPVKLKKVVKVEHRHAGRSGHKRARPGSTTISSHDEKPTEIEGEGDHDNCNSDGGSGCDEKDISQRRMIEFREARGSNNEVLEDREEGTEKTTIVHFCRDKHIPSLLRFPPKVIIRSFFMSGESKRDKEDCFVFQEIPSSSIQS